MSVWGPIAMQRCETCKYWLPFDSNQKECIAKRNRLGLCEKIEVESEYEEKAHWEDDRGVRGISVASGPLRWVVDSPERSTVAMVEEGPSGAVGFRCAATFGCVLHEPKEG